MNLLNSNKIKTEPRSKARRERNFINKITFLKIGIIAIILLFCVAFQVRLPKIFGATPALCLGLICAVGFIFGKNGGAVAGIAGGFLCDCVGGLGFSFSVLFFMLCGYLCGALIGTFLSENFPSFLIYGLMVGVVRECLNFAYIMVFSSSFSPMRTVIYVLLPDLAAFALTLPFVYFFVLVIKKLTDKLQKE